MLRAILCVLGFLVCVTVCAKVRSRNARQGVLLIASYVFYLTWGAWFAPILLASTVMNVFPGEMASTEELWA